MSSPDENWPKLHCFGEKLDKFAQSPGATDRRERLTE